MQITNLADLADPFLGALDVELSNFAQTNLNRCG
jgi:hypothetical protein